MKRILDAVSILIFDGLGFPVLRGQITLNLTIWAEIRNRKDPVFRIFYHIKNRRENSVPTKSSGFMVIPVLKGSGLEGF